MQCEHCSSTRMSWFTPARDRGAAAVLLCGACRRLTIVPPRHAARAQRGPVAPQRRAA